MGTKTKPLLREHPDSVYLFRIVGTDFYKIGISGNVGLFRRPPARHAVQHGSCLMAIFPNTA